MAKRYNRRSTRPREDLPSLFVEGEQASGHVFEVIPGESDNAAGVTDEFVVEERFARAVPKIRFISFGSGSSGNCSYVGTPAGGLLVDGGVDNNFVTAELGRNGIDMRTIKGILLTHDHADHVRYSYALLRRNPHMRLYCTPRTIEGVLRRHNISRRISEYHSPIYKEHEYTFGDMTVVPFDTSHDGTDNVGFSFTLGATTFVIATDMGVITERADYYMRRANALMIEANYDDMMLEKGKYPEYLKARIRSPRGHMCNSDTARYLTDTYRVSLTHIFLCHLSDDNNTPETAVATVLNALRTISVLPAPSSAQIPPGSVYLSALPRFRSSDLYILG